jgi:hypothetical protein
MSLVRTNTVGAAVARAAARARRAVSWLLGAGWADVYRIRCDGTWSAESGRPDCADCGPPGATPEAAAEAARANGWRVDLAGTLKQLCWSCVRRYDEDAARRRAEREARCPREQG